VERLQGDRLQRIVATRAHATARKIIASLPASPVLDANRAAELSGASTVSARKALMRFQEAGAVSLLHHDARRGRVWVADELLGILNAFDCDLAGPLVGATVSGPALAAIVGTPEG
jgi:hypothetical protein